MCGSARIIFNYHCVKFSLLYKYKACLQLQVFDDRQVTQRDRNSRVNVTLRTATRKRWKRDRTGKCSNARIRDETRDFNLAAS